MTEKSKAEKVEVQFHKAVTVNGQPYAAGQIVKIDADEADNVIAGNYAVAYTEELKKADELRKELPQNVPLKESDLVIATHDSGEKVAYKDPREKGPATDDSRKIEALPPGDLPTGVPYGAMVAAQAQKVTPNVEPDTELDTKAAAKAADAKASNKK